MSADTASVLERIVAETRAQLASRKAAGATLGAVDEDAAGRRAGVFREALRAPGIGVIAEFKRRSPSAGTLREHADLAELVDAYARGGAIAISVLTEQANFEGSIEDLRAARGLCELPLLRKDFIVDALQLQEARAAGADAVLLIVAALAQRELGRLHEQAGELGLDVLVEAHDRDELERALAAGARIIGINNRDLRDFSVDVERTERLLGAVPDGVLVVSESGIRSPEQLARLSERGVHAVLVGESLMRSGDPAGALRTLASGVRAPGKKL
jgi:indole-3-glycerol phosphate synthase